VKALARTADEYDYDARLMNAVEAVNDDQKHVLFDKVSHYFRVISAARPLRSGAVLQAQDR